MGVSDGYVRLTTPGEIAAAEELRDNWKAPEIPGRQLAVSEPELERFWRGEPSPPFDAFGAALDATGLAWRCSDASRSLSIVDVGCSTGYYAQVLRHCGYRGAYMGVDYSEAMVEAARARRAGEMFEVGDARALRFRDASFDIVVSGCFMLHTSITEWPASLAEAARIARKWVVLHRTPIAAGETEYWRKAAYDVPCIEIHVSRSDLLAMCAAAGLAREFVHRISGTADGAANETWLMKKVGP